MELDKRIRSIVDILTVINSDMGGIIGKTGYFGNSIMDFKRLDTCNHGKLTGIIRNTDRCFEYENCADSGRKGYCYFIPEDYLLPEEPEKKYRPYSLNEFLERFKIGDAIYIRFKRDGAERVVVFSEYSIPPHKDEGNDTESVCLTGMEHHKSVVCLGMREYNLTTLFDCYEYFDGKEWQPFGVIEDD